jgi:hypothetical protein
MAGDHAFRSRRWLIVGLALLGVVLLAVTSFILGHDSWPWTVTREHTASFRGVRIGSDKHEVLEQVAVAAQHDVPSQLWLIDADLGGQIPLKTEHALSPEEEGYVARIDRWRLDWRGNCVCWADLEFRGGKLESIRERRYRGPIIE